MSYDDRFKQPFGQGGFQRQNYSNNNSQSGYQNNRPQGGEQQPRQDRPLPEATFYLPYAVVGNRDTPAGALALAKDMAAKLASRGFTARLGGMDGLDKTIADALTPQAYELQLPWKNFGGFESKTSYSSPEVMAIAKHFSDTWDTLKLPIQGFLGKNVRVLLGEKTKSIAMFLVVHSEDGAEHIREVTSRTGSVGHAIKIANHFNIPVFNLQKQDALTRLYQQFHMLKDETRPMIEDDRDD